MKWVSLGIGILVTVIVFIVVPLAITVTVPGEAPNGTVWTNEQYHVIGDKYEWGAACPPDGVCHDGDYQYLGDGPGYSPFFQMLKVFALIGFLSFVAFITLLYMRGPYEPEQDELFERWDGRQ
jgi:hypothetical protein